jgi:O-antigen ligase
MDRMRSVGSTEDVSNKGRLRIWRESFQSLKDNPLLGVGIGNFPVVLSEPISYVKSGSTAHNLFLHIGVTIGLFGAIIFLLLWVEVLRQAWNFLTQKKTDPVDRFYILVSFLFLVWVLTYSLTDAALFDSRAFLAFIVLIGSFRALVDKLAFSYE